MPCLTAPSNPKLKGGSNKHGSGLNELIKQVDTEYVLIMDCDCLLVRPFVIKQDILGAKKTDTTMHMCFLAGKTELLKQQDFRPAGGLVSYPPYLDVGYQLGPMNQDLQLIDCKTGNGKIFGPDIQCDEIWYNGNPIATHFGRGSNLGAKKVRDGRDDTLTQLNQWLNIANKYRTKIEWQLDLI